MKPMLACSTQPELDQLTYPVMASPKLDGIRCLLINGVAYSRNMKPIPNKFIQSELGGLPVNNLDGELMVKGDFNNVQSAVMSEHGEPDFTYIVFDTFTVLTAGYYLRAQQFTPQGRITTVTNTFIPDKISLEKYFEHCLIQGYEGVIVRDPTAPYKQGRSTLKQGWMLKLKKWNDAEATVTGFTELEHNENDADVGELGQTTRSNHKAGMVRGHKLGALIVSFNGETFKIGSGFNDAQREFIWNNRKEYLGCLVTFKYQELSKYGVPRFPIFKGFRNINDLCTAVQELT